MTGLDVLKGSTPHYDVLAKRGSPLAQALAKAFNLPELADDEAQASQAFLDEAASQEQTSIAQIEALVCPEDLKRQAELFEVRYINAWSV